jgi:opacity protein-like surface antigen
MSFKRCILATLVLVFLNSAFLAFSQVRPAAREGQVPLTVGGGFSDYSADWGPGRRIDGTSVWIDWYPWFIPRRLRGLGFDFEGRDLSFGRSSELPSNFRQDTAGGGVIYSVHHWTKFRPYGKGLIEYGSFDFDIGSPTYHHDTRTVEAMGAGLDYHAWGPIWVRGDYEYQVWQQMFNRGNPTPNGFTIGAVYDFRPWHEER